ncbi:MAG: HEAT repeat domain-containing protein [Planctomycetes bacterium]|nr:HEAT repeat domain-containing protein [Planctomycetota bacterium]
MRLFFCDICNESIPLQDIKEGKSTTIKGKIFCRKCNPLNELATPEGGAGASPPAAGASGVLRVVAVMLFLVICGLGYLIYELKAPRGEAQAGARAEQVAALERGLAGVSGDLAAVRGELAAAAVPGELLERVARLEETASGFAASLSRLVQDVAELQAGVVAVGSLRDRVEGLALRQEEAAQKHERLAGTVAELRAETAALGAGAPAASPPGEEAAAPVPAEATGEAPLDPELLAIVEMLSAADSMTRWEAVDQIRRRRDKALIPHVIPLLDDRDTFVRAQAIYTLGELKAMSAVPRLIALLRDDEVMIREEALTSLVVITGQNMKFDVDGARSARDKGIRKWEEWLEKNRDKF